MVQMLPLLIVLEVRLAHEHTLLKIMVQLDRRGWSTVVQKNVTWYDCDV